MRTVDERASDLTSAIFQAMDSSSTSVRVAMPGIVQSWDQATQTVSVQLAIKERISNGGSAKEVNIPVLVDVPVVFPSAGGYSFLAVPQSGDECLVIFADMCIDAWWKYGNVQSQADKRRHDLSDGFAIMGCWSQPNLKQAFPSSGCVMQNSDGSAGISIKSGTVDIFGTFTVNGKKYVEHKHSGVESGGGNTGGVV